MKKILIFFILLLGIKSYAQTDSSKLYVSVTLPAKDINYYGWFIYRNDDIFGDLADSTKPKYRGGQDNQDNNNIVITAMVQVWLDLDRELRNDADAVRNNVFKRVGDALKLLTTQTYLIRKLTEADAIDVITYQDRRATGKQKHKRNN